MKTIKNGIILIDHRKFDAKILLQGAQIIDFTPKGTHNIFWHTNLEHYTQGKAFRGGVPICWPWFNKVGTPSHGFARISLWEIESYTEDDEGVEIIFCLKDSPKTKEIWDHAFEIQISMRLGSSCALEFRVLNCDVSSTAALHSYFRVSDIANVKVTGLGESYSDSLDGGTLKRSDGTLVVHSAVDRIYTHPQDTNTLFKNSHEILRIQHLNASDVVCWNPWLQGAQNIADMQESDYKKMICIESARINKPLQESESLGVSILFSS